MMQRHDKRIIHSSEESNWRTPPACFNKLMEEFDFTIDFAADRASRCCPIWYGPGSGDGEDALCVNWEQDTGFLNPPFSKTKVNAYRTGRIKGDGAWFTHPVNLQLAKVYDIGQWALKCWEESQKGATIVGIFPYAPQTIWYRQYVWGLDEQGQWLGHAAVEERRLPYRISFLRPDGSPAGNAGVNSAILIWKPNPGYVGPWSPTVRYWSYL